MTGIEEALLIGGLVASAGGKIAAGVSQANASATDAALKNQQAEETLLRAHENEALIQEQAGVVKAGYETGVAAQGSASAGIGGELQIQRYANEKIANMEQEAQFEAQMTRAGASMEAQLGQEQMISGIVGAGGSLLTGGAGVYQAVNKPSNVAQPLFGGL
jgi:hypothetical protein